VQQANIGANVAYYNYIDVNGCTNVDSTIIVVDHCVWPGDANEDLIVDNTDLLPIGLKYGATGAARTSINSTWQGYTCSNWNDTLSNGKNIKYTDCDGSGVINFNDTLAVNLNFNLTHTSAKYAAPQIVQTTNPDVYVNFSKNLYHPGDTVFAYINIGSSTNQQTNFYGSAFTINYDYTKVKHGTEKFYFNNSWVGNINQSKIKFSKLFANTGVVDASLTRITHADTNGFGKVATLQFILRDTITSNEFYVTINNGIKTNNAGTYSNLNTGTDSVALSQGITAINQISNNSTIKIYPNPANNKITIDANDVVDIKLFDVLGNEITSVKQNQIDVSNFNDGVYFIQVQTSTGTTTQKIIVQH
jgi:hypothetical protein